ncbi:MAG: class I SAM-dependent methyltransferase [Bacteroides sp.]|nr:class I SAM-dependent methyltransferase [Bacteroides sp.]
MYKRYILPRVIDWACSQPTGMLQREMVIPMARGQVLEVGIGSGKNLPFYDGSRVEHLTGIDPMDRLWDRNKTALSSLDFDVVYLKASAERIPHEDNSFHTVVSTSTLCSIKNIGEALKEMYRVLKPDGSLIFAEHGAAPDAALARRQNLLNPIWKQIGGGCNLNRDIPGLLREAGFNLDGMSEGYQEGWRPVSYHYWGWATKVESL